MSTLLAVSPHLDDAVFSAGAELARRAADGWRVVIATCFTGNVAHPGGFALACQLDKGLGAQVDYMALRRAEDMEACAVLGAESVHLPFLEAPHRGYTDAAALFGEPLPEAELECELGASLAEMQRYMAPALIMAPEAIGGHVDHRLVRRVVDRIAAAAVTYWADLPYAARTDASLRELGPTPCGAFMSRKRVAAMCYRSQLSFQLRGEDIDAGLAIDGAEWFSPAANRPYGSDALSRRGSPSAAH